MNDHIIIDLDDTITIDSSSDDYAKKELNLMVLDAIKNAIDTGFSIKIFSARNMNSFQGNISKIEAHTRPIAENWLKKNKIPHSELILGKPWAGKDGFYVDDKNLHIEEFIFKFCSPFHKNKVSIIVPFFNEENNVMSMHAQNKKAERLLNIHEFIYVNNGSTDSSIIKLEEIKKNDPKIKIINLQKNMGYGGGMKEGLLNATGDLIITNHADLQFDLYQFLISNYNEIISCNTIEAITPRRINRNRFEEINSFILRKIISIALFKKINDFNGQPKIFKRHLLSDLSCLPKNYCFDLAIYMIVYKSALTLPVMQNIRKSGYSSWNSSLLKRLKIFLEYIKFAITNRWKFI
jgi:capsule biosynthesis phosphatase